MPHKGLCYRAERWLLNTCKCNFALRELTTQAVEIPDAIGWCESACNNDPLLAVIGIEN